MKAHKNVQHYNINVKLMKQRKVLFSWKIKL